jgi:hypothetical protein
MSLTADIEATKDRFHVYIEQLIALLLDYNIPGSNWYENLKKANSDPLFKRRRDEIWKRILEQEGGKISMAIILWIVGAVLGRVGIAAFGSAIGLSLVVLLVPAGILVGNEMDSAGITKNIVDIVGSWFGSPKEATPHTPAPNIISDSEKLARWQESMQMRRPTDPAN